MKITDFIKENLLYLDGGMGTLLQARGMKPGELPERWNISHPEVITQIHKAYYDAGSHVVNINTFGANSLKFSLEELDQIVQAAVKNARAAAEASSADQPKWIALDIGPCGKLLSPYGTLDFEDAVSVFANTVRLGVKYGVDLIFIETMNDSYETKAALLAAKENSDLPVFVSNAYGDDGKLMTGASPAAMIAMLEGMGADAIGINCSLGPQALEKVAKEYLQLASVPVLFKPNAGLPRSVNGKTVFDIDPDQFVAEILPLMDSGLSIVGGCCGTTPEYIAQLAQKTAGLIPQPQSDKPISWVSSYTHAVAFGNAPLLIGERINPTGKKRFRQALIKKDIDYILAQGIQQQEAGAHILDVNVGLPDIVESELLPDVICQLQAIIDLPLQIDTSDPVAMEAALRRYNGKALINSVNGKEESMAAVFPLAKKYGGMIVALTLDENGIPETADGRVKIAKKILETAQKYGIESKNLIFDPLAMTVSTNPAAATETLAAVDQIRNILGCHTVLGISNISFGLPARELLNSTFFTMAMSRGLSAAIINPVSGEMKKAYFTWCALSGKDINYEQYISFASGITQRETVNINVSDDLHTELQNAIIKGRKEQAATLTAALLDTNAPLDVVNQEIIPALNVVGEGFEKKTMYLPQLLMSAEAARFAFDEIKKRVPADTSSARGPIVIATVHGDIHDIGKNIVSLLLENYGFSVIDLGKDVLPETIAEAVERLHAPIAGLSALMTTTVPAMEKTIQLLRRKAPWCKIMVGGAVLTHAYADAIGADFYAKDAMEAVRCAETILV